MAEMTGNPLVINASKALELAADAITANDLDGCIAAIDLASRLLRSYRDLIRSAELIVQLYEMMGKHHG